MTVPLPEKTFNGVKWLPPVLFSIDVTVMLVAVFLVTKMSYSKTSTATHLSFYPYYVILAYLACEMLELLMIIHQINIYDSEANKVNYITSIVWYVIDMFSVLKFVCFIGFVGC